MCIRDRDYLICVNTREVEQAMLTKLNNLILSGKDLKKEIVGTNKHRKTATQFIRNTGLVPDPRSEGVMNLPVDVMVQLFGFDHGHLNTLATSMLRRRAMGESIQAGLVSIRTTFKLLLTRTTSYKQAFKPQIRSLHKRVSIDVPLR